MSKSTDLTLFDSPQLVIPDYVKAFYEEESNIDDRITVPSLSYSGKIWAITVDGEKSNLMRRDEEGDEVPIPIMRVVVLDFNKQRGRAFFEGSYDPDNPGQPTCWSTDGVTPDTAVAEPQCATCADCPMSAKGSKVSESGKAVTACSQHRLLAVVPSKKLDFKPLRLKIAVTSDYDKQSPELAAKGWYGFTQYTQMLKSRGVEHTASVVTKMRFDPDAAYPKVIFSAEKFLDEAEMAQAREVAGSEEVANLISGTFGPPAPAPAADDAPTETARKEPKDMADDERAALQAQAIKAAEKKAETDKKALAEKKALAAKKKAADEKATAEKKASAKPKTAVAELMDDDDDVDEALLKEAKSAKDDASDDDTAGGDIPDDISDILSSWDDE